MSGRPGGRKSGTVPLGWVYKIEDGLTLPDGYYKIVTRNATQTFITVTR